MRAETLDRIPVSVYIVALVAMAWLVEQNVAVNLRGNKYGNIALFYINAVGITLLLWGLSEKYVHFAGKTRLCAYLESIGRDSLVYLCTNQALITIAEMTIGNVLPITMWSFKIVTFIFVMSMGHLCGALLKYVKVCPKYHLR